MLATSCRWIWRFNSVDAETRRNQRELNSENACALQLRVPLQKPVHRLPPRRLRDTGTCDPPAIVHSSTSTPLGHPPSTSHSSRPREERVQIDTPPSANSAPVHPFFAAHVAIVCASDGYDGCVFDGTPGAISPAVTAPPS